VVTVGAGARRGGGMRRMLASLASLWVGTVAIIAVISLLFLGFVSVIVTLIVGWIPAVLVGVVVSAPYFVRPPEDLRRADLWTPPIEQPVVTWVFRAVSRTGWVVLCGAWWLIYRVWDPRSTTRPTP
jgi:hypothetical protein